MGTKQIFNNFTGGEVSSTLSARYDLQRYLHCCRHMENFLPGLHGDVKRRPGTRHVGTLSGKAVLIPFRFSVERAQNFVLVFGDNNIRVANEDGLESANIARGYNLADLYELSYAQVGDVVYLAHKKYPLRKIERRGSPGAYTWDLVDVALNSSLPAPSKPTVKFTKVEDKGTGYALNYKVVAVDADGKQSLPSPTGSDPNGKFPTDWVVGESCKITWSHVDGATEYNVYRESGGVFGFIGVVQAASASGGTFAGMGIGTQKVGAIKYAGAITRTIDEGHLNDPPSDTTTPLTVAASSSQNAFLTNGLLFVFVTKTTKNITWEFNGVNNKWESTVTTTTEKFWAAVSCPSGNPVGSYDSYDRGTLSGGSDCPSGSVGAYTVWPSYSAGTTLTFVDNNYEADVSDTPREDWDPFADGNYPSTVAFHQQRMVLGGTVNSPQTFYLSRTGDFENFRKSRPLQDDDPVEYALASGSIDSIAWITSFGDLLLGTSGAEFKATGESGVITAKSVQITSQSYWGSAALAPIIVGNSVLHVQRHGSRVRDLFYSLEKDGYSGNDLSIMAPHLFNGHKLLQWCYQQTPNSTVWAVRDDGVLLGFTYMKEQDIWGWSIHPTDGNVVSVAAISGDKADVVMLVVERDGQFFLERLADEWDDTESIETAYYVDCGKTLTSDTAKTEWDGLDHLEGKTVSILAGGSPVEGEVVTGGKVTVPYPVQTVSVGLPYRSYLEPVALEANTQTGTTLSKMRGYGNCSVRLHRSVGGEYGPNVNELYDLPFVPAVWGDACEPFSGDMEFNAATAQDPGTSVCFVQRRALPMTIIAIVVDVDFGEE